MSGLALSNWTNRSVSSACVAVMLMAGLDVDVLRVVLTTAYLVSPVTVLHKKLD